MAHVLGWPRRFQMLAPANQPQRDTSNSIPPHAGSGDPSRLLHATNVPKMYILKQRCLRTGP